MWAALVAAILLAPALNPPAPPPSRIVFASPRTGVAQLYSVEPSGEGLAQLTFGAGNWGFPVPSPDGQFVAAFRGPELWVDYPGELVPAPRPELWLMRADGSGAQLVSRDAAGVSWSSDSRRLVFGSAGSIWTVAVPGGQPERLTSGYYDTLPSVSPDGRSIAFARANQPGVWQVVVRRNGHERIVAQGLAASPAWSPNGKWIAIHGLDTVDVVRPTGGVVQAFSAVPRLCSVPCPPPVMAWSPDSSRLAFETQDGIELAAPPAAGATLLVKGLTQGLAWSPGGDAVAFAVPDGVRVATLDGHIGDPASFGPGGLQWGIGWSPGWPSLLYQTPEDAALVRVSGRELEARFPIRQLSADGDRVAYWLCPHTFEAWRPGDAPVVLGPGTVAACLIPVLDWGPESNVYDLTLAGDRLAYLTQSGVNTWTWQLWLTTLERGDEGVAISSGSQTSGNAPRWAELEDLVGGGSALVYGQRGVSPYAFHPEEVWRVDGATPVQVASRSDDYQPLAVDGGRIVARWIDGSLDLLSLDGHVLEAFDVPSLGAALAGDDLVVLVQSELRDYSVSSGELLHAWPLPDVPSSGRCRLYSCPGIRLTLDDTARGLVVYTLDRVVHLLRLSDGADATVPGATAAEITDDGLFYAYLGEDPWPGRIRFVPFDELPLP